jgi:hypothetical protein
MPEWRPIPNTNYLASDEGEIRHVSSEKPRKLQRQHGGYVYVNLWRNKRLIMVTVHSLVAAAFLGPRPEGSQIRHLDGKRSNNRPGNLVYGTAKENAADRERHGKTMRGQRNGNAKLSDDEVNIIRFMYERGDITQYELADVFKASQAQINNIILKKQRVA